MIHEFLSDGILHQGLEQVNYLCKKQSEFELAYFALGDISLDQSQIHLRRSIHQGSQLL